MLNQPTDDFSATGSEAARLESFRAHHRVEHLTLMFTDIVGSTHLKQQWGERDASTLLQGHDSLIRGLLATVEGAKEIGTAGDSFFIVFARPPEAVRFALVLQHRLRQFAAERRRPLSVRIGAHLGEVFVEDNPDPTKPKRLFGLAVDLTARIMSLAQGGQILISQPVFDAARFELKSEDVGVAGPIEWRSHGPYQLKGIESAIEVCEVGESGSAPLSPPENTEKVHRRDPEFEDQVIGWRPAAGQRVPTADWIMEARLGEGGFGEIWLARNPATGTRRVLKFCFKASRARSLKREATLFLILRDRVGTHPNMVQVYEVNLDSPPFYLVMDYVEGGDLKTWTDRAGGIATIPQSLLLELISQVADGLQSAHDAGVIHRDVKPGNILIGKTADGEPVAKLSDYGIGQVVSEDYLKSTDGLGFTRTLVAEERTSHGGTHLYLAPELLEGRPASTRSDIYGLAVILYQVLVGDLRRPLTADWAKDIEDPLLRSDLEICLAGQPEKRFAGASQLAVNLRSLEKRRAAVKEEEARLIVLARTAYRKGVMRAAGFAGLVIAFISILAVVAWKESKRAQQMAGTLSANLYAADMNVAYRSLFEENYGRAINLVKKYSDTGPLTIPRGFEWRHIAGLCRGDQDETLYAHDDAVSSLAFSHDGRYMVSSSYDTTVRLWDYAALRPVRRFTSLVHPVQLGGLGYAETQHGPVIAAGSWSPPVVVWSAEAGRELARLTNASAPLKFSPDGRRLAARVEDGVRVWDTASWASVAHATLPPVQGAMVYSPDGRVLAVGTARNLVLYDSETLTRLPGLPSDGEEPYSVAFSPDGRLMAFGGQSGAIHLWNWPALTKRATWRPHRTWVFGLSFSKDGTQLASAGDHGVMLWDVATQGLVAKFQGHEDEMGNVVHAPDGKSLVSCGKDRSIRIWSKPPRRMNRTLPAAGVPLWFSADGETLLSLNSPLDGAINLWGTQEGKMNSVVQCRDLGIPFWRMTAASPDGSRIALGMTNGSGVIQVRRAPKWEIETVLDGGGVDVRSVVFSPGGECFASVNAAQGRKEGILSLWSTATWKPLLRNRAKITSELKSGFTT